MYNIIRINSEKDFNSFVNYCNSHNRRHTISWYETSKNYPYIIHLKNIGEIWGTYCCKRICQSCIGECKDFNIINIKTLMREHKLKRILNI